MGATQRLPPSLLLLVASKRELEGEGRRERRASERERERERERVHQYTLTTRVIHRKIETEMAIGGGIGKGEREMGFVEGTNMHTQKHCANKADDAK